MNIEFTSEEYAYIAQIAEQAERSARKAARKCKRDGDNIFTEYHTRAAEVYLSIAQKADIHRTSDMHE